MIIPGCSPGTGAVGDPVYQGSAFAAGGVPIAGADGSVATDTDLTFSGDTLTATKFAGDGAALTGLPSGVTAGATFPVSPTYGQMFLHTPTGRKILYQYDGSMWVAIEALSNVVVYVDNGSVTGTVGTDNLNHGFGTGINAFATLNYAWDMLPATFPSQYKATIILAAGTYNETIQTSDTYGASNVNIVGATITLLTSTAIGGLAGSGANVPYVSGTFLVGQYDKKLLKFGLDHTGAQGANYGKVCPISQTTTTAIYLANTTLPIIPSNGDQYEILDWATTITGNWLLNTGSRFVVFNYLNLTATTKYQSYGNIIWSLNTIAAFYYCNVYSATVDAFLADEKSLIVAYYCVLGGCVATLGGGLDLQEDVIQGVDNATGYGVSTDRNSVANVVACSISKFDRGVSTNINGVASLIDSGIYNRVYGTGTGLCAFSSGVTIYQNTVLGLNPDGTSNANGGDTYADTGTFALVAQN
jgi:hypothetical protein